MIYKFDGEIFPLLLLFDGQIFYQLLLSFSF